MKAAPLSSLLVYLVLQFAVLGCQGAVQIIPLYDQNQYRLLSGENYVDKDQPPIDIVWTFDTSIRLEITDFELDGQSGDFLLISDTRLALPPDYDPDMEATDPEFTESILTSEGLLLSWEVLNKTIQIHNRDFGTFIYFHAEEFFGDRRKSFRGFDIVVKDFDALRTTTPRSTPEPAVTHPDNNDIYYTVFLNCMEPMEFLRNKDDFKQVLADMANKYCNDTDVELERDFLFSDVSIPDKDGVFYCDRNWKSFAHCVEVRFAIVGSNSSGDYIMVKQKLKDMWKVENSTLDPTKYCPFDPPKDEKEINTWVYVAFILGMTFVFFSLLCIVWVKKETDEYIQTTAFVRVQDDANAEKQNSFSDPQNPVLDMILKMLRRKGHEDTTYSEMNKYLGELVDTDVPNVKNNKLFRKESENEYDNKGYLEDVEVELESPSVSGRSKYLQNSFAAADQVSDISDTEV